MANGGQLVHGRGTECRVLDRLVEAVRAGEAGHGSAWRGGRGQDRRCWSTGGARAGLPGSARQGVESERELAFAGLHQRCAPMLDQLERFRCRSVMRCGPRSRLRRARRRIGYWSAWPCGACCPRRRERAADLPRRRRAVARRASAQVLAFVARRLGRNLSAWPSRPGSRHQPGRVAGAGGRGLREADAGALLDSVLTGPIDGRVRNRSWPRRRVYAGAAGGRD